MNKTILHTTCPNCNSGDLSKHIDTRDYYSTQQKFKIDKCNSCGLLFTNPRPNDRAITKYYDSKNYISHSTEAKGFINRIYRIAQNFNSSLKYKAISEYVPRGTWLDYGCGNAAFLSYIRNKGISIQGFEPNKNDTSFDKSLSSSIFSEIEEIPKQSKFATITMWHVLEHVPEPFEVLSSHYERLVEKGILILALPNYESWDAQYYKQFWAAYDTPRHLWHYSREVIGKIGHTAGFEILAVKPLILDSFYVSLLSEKYKKGSSIRGIFQGLRSNIKAKKGYLPYSSQIYIFRKRA